MIALDSAARLGRRLERRAGRGLLSALAATLAALLLLGGLSALLGAGYLLLASVIGAPGALAVLGALATFLGAIPLLALRERLREPAAPRRESAGERTVGTEFAVPREALEAGKLVGEALSKLGPTGALALAAGLGAAVVVAADREGQTRKAPGRDNVRREAWNGAADATPRHPQL